MSFLAEICRLVGRLLPESVCRLCGYDNPYMDPVDDYVCRQCTSRSEKWSGSGTKKAAGGRSMTPVEVPVDLDALKRELGSEETYRGGHEAYKALAAKYGVPVGYDNSAGDSDGVGPSITVVLPNGTFEELDWEFEDDDEGYVGSTPESQEKLRDFLAKVPPKFIRMTSDDGETSVYTPEEYISSSEP